VLVLGFIQDKHAIGSRMYNGLMFNIVVYTGTNGLWSVNISYARNSILAEDTVERRPIWTR